MTAKNERTVRVLLERRGETYAREAGVSLRDTPAPLFQLLVLSVLLSARIQAGIAVAAARALFDAGMRDARRMADATWQQRVDALGEGGYRRYDERTSTLRGRAAEMVQERYKGDLRALRETGEVRERLGEVPGIGPSGTDIFLREVQGIWPEFAPLIDGKARDGARRLGLPVSAEKLASLVDEADLPRLAAGLVRVALDKKAAQEVRDLAARSG
jgi:endonuclease III